MSEADFRRGQRLGPGIYAYQGALHIDEREFVLAAGGDPDSERDCAAARRIAQDVATTHGIPSEVRAG